jgi:hypothetical protein
MNPLSSLPDFDDDRSDPGDPQSDEHIEVHAAYADLPKGVAIAKDLRDYKRPAGARGRAVGMRPWSQIVGITLHQTATRDFPSDHPGLSNVPAHAMVHRDGRVSLLHHPTAYVQHGNALNGGTIGIEVACRAAGTEGDVSTFWRSSDERMRGKTYLQLVNEANGTQLYSLSQLIRYYYDLVAAHGGKLLGLWAHRQGAASRTSDPGSRIWYVAERMRIELGLNDYRDRKLGTGNTIPLSWRIETA